MGSRERDSLRRDMRWSIHGSVWVNRGLRLKVFPLEEIMLVDAWGAAEAIRSKNQIQCLQHCGLSRVIVSQQNSMPGKIESGIVNATEILDLEAANLHWNLNLATRPKITRRLFLAIGRFYLSGVNTRGISSTRPNP